MTKNKTLYELGQEYEEAAKNVKRIIDRKRSELKSLRDSVCSHEAFVLKNELKTLYAEYRQACETAEYLKTYYDPHSGKRELMIY